MNEYANLCNTKIDVANKNHIKYALEICNLISKASKEKNTALALRTNEYIEEKISSGKAIIAIHKSKIVGFCYIETWENKEFVANSGLVVDTKFRKTGLAKKIKKAAFDLSKKKYPNAKIFGLTTSLSVMKINSSLGYKPVTLSLLTNDMEFWKGCETCMYYDILVRTKRKQCLCTAMIN